MNDGQVVSADVAGKTESSRSSFFFNLQEHPGGAENVPGILKGDLHAGQHGVDGLEDAADVVRHVFLGVPQVEVAGASLQVDDKSNAAYYEKEGVRPSGILSGKEVKTPASAEKLITTLGKVAPAAAK